MTFLIFKRFKLHSNSDRHVKKQKNQCGRKGNYGNFRK